MEMLELSEDQDTDTGLIRHVVSPSELDVMRQCPLRHQLLYGERWTKPILDEGHPLTFGTLWHRVTEIHYRAIESHQRAARVDQGDWSLFDQAGALALARTEIDDALDTVEDQEVVELLRWMYDGHVEQYGADPEWQIMAIEHAAEVSLPAPAGFKSPFEFRIKMRMDMIVKWKGRLWVIDRKSCKNLPSNLELDLDDQFGLYIWGLRQMGRNVFGAIHDAARKTRLKTKEAPLDERFKRSPMHRGDKELDRIALEAWQDAHERYQALGNVVEMRRNGIDVEAQRHPSPMTCRWKCDFTEACIAGRKGIDLRSYIKGKGYVKDRSRH